MDPDILGHNDDEIGVQIYDERDNEHVVHIGWNGSIEKHYVDNIPHDPADRTNDEQRILSQVEARAKFAAHREFPDADILHPMWDIDHLERGVEALSNYPLDQFHRTFRDFYEALESPHEFVPDASRVDDRTWEIHKSFTITPDNRIDDVLDVALVAATEDGDSIEVGPEPPDYDRAITAGMPMMDFADDFDYEDEFHEIVLANLMAQIRDLYLHMGEQPPERYRIEGFGKFSINGDRTHAEWRGVTDENGELIGPK